jgi:hypothetical protein
MHYDSYGKDAPNPDFDGPDFSLEYLFTRAQRVEFMPRARVFWQCQVSSVR